MEHAKVAVFVALGAIAPAFAAHWAVSARRRGRARPDRAPASWLYTAVAMLRSAAAERTSRVLKNPWSSVSP